MVTILLFREHKSRAFYRIQATRNMTGGGDIIKNKGDKIAEMKSLAGDVSAVVTQDPDADPSVTRVQFVQKDYRVSFQKISKKFLNFFFQKCRKSKYNL